MQVLITGGFGFVGRNLSRYLAAQGHRLLALDVERQESGAYDQFYTWEEMKDIDWGHVNAVVHLAGKAHDTHNTSGRLSYFEVNVGLTKRILESAVRGWQSVHASTCCTPRKFVFFSSVKAVADRVDGVLTEDAAPSPMTAYGQSKLEAEREVLKFASSNVRESASAKHADWANEGDVRTYILRPCMIHGPGNKGNLNLLYGAVRKGLPWPLGAYENERSFASVENVCAVVNGLLTAPVASGIFQVADDEALSTNELIRVMAYAMGRHPRIMKVPRTIIDALAKVGDVVHLPLNSERLKKLTESYIVSNDKIKSALGWSQMPVRAEDGLRVTMESFGQIQA